MLFLTEENLLLELDNQSGQLSGSFASYIPYAIAGALIIKSDF
ncbi:hypothetical protein [Candidatus Lokiarchaeum ossiferum]